MAQDGLDVCFGRGDQPRGLADLGKSGGDKVGVDEGDDDALVFELTAESLRERVHEGLAAAVDGEQRRGDGAAERANVGNPAVLSDMPESANMYLTCQVEGQETDCLVILGTTMRVMSTRP